MNDQHQSKAHKENEHHSDNDDIELDNNDDVNVVNVDLEKKEKDTVKDKEDK